MSKYRYDLAVVGAGPGGVAAAVRAAQLGLKVALIEKDAVGGVCLNKGCIPSKALIRSAYVFDLIRESDLLGLKIGEAEAQFDKIQLRSRQVVERLSKGLEFVLKKFKIPIFHGEALIVNPNQILAGEQSTLDTERILIATGSRVRSIPGFIPDGKFVVTSDDVLFQKELPRSILILGGGVLGVEFAYLFGALGCEVTILEAQSRILPMFDPEISHELERAFKKKHINILTKCRASRADIVGNVVRVPYQDATDAEKEVFSAQILVAVGRQPSTTGLGLEGIGVQFVNGWVQVNDRYQSTVPSIYAVGDVIGEPFLAHAASEEAKLAVEMMAGLKSERVNSENIPSCVYCHPEIASIGLSEDEAKKRGADVYLGKAFFKASGRALAEGEDTGFIKVVLNKEGRLLGAQVIGASATELITSLTLIKTLGLTVDQISKVVFAHPTFSETILEALELARAKGASS